MHSTQAAAALLAIHSLWAAAAMAQHPVMEIRVTGLTRLKAEAVMAASGIRKGQMATHAQLSAAAERLADTGFFASVSFRYDPKTVDNVTGYALTFAVSEQPARTHLELDIPGLESAGLWRQLQSADGLLDPDMPNNDRALAYYKRRIEAVLKKLNHPEEIVLKTQANLKTGQMAIVCRPAHLPRVAAIRFAGNAAVGSGALTAAMRKVAVGQDYSEREFRQMLDLNVRPIYEELGHLTVAFPRVSMSDGGEGGVTVTAEIEEGPAWKLGRVALRGDSLPLADMHEAAEFAYGSAANWKQFLETLDKMEQVLKRNGYLRVSAETRRSFRDSAQVVDVDVEFQRGPQFYFGELHIEGLDEATEERLAHRWKLEAGAPMDQPYVNEFVRAEFGMLRGKYRTFSSELKVHDANMVDVNLLFH